MKERGAHVRRRDDAGGPVMTRMSALEWWPGEGSFLSFSQELRGAPGPQFLRP